MTTNKSKWLMGLVIILLLANTATLVLFWAGRAKHAPPPKGEVKDYLVKELNMDSAQQSAFELLRREHHEGVDSLRKILKTAKDKLFALVKDPTASDSLQKQYAAEASTITGQIDLITVRHFQKLRALCRPDQQKRFDELLEEVIGMLGSPRAPGPPGPRDGRPPRPEGPGHEGPEGHDGPPPPNGN